MNEPRQVGVSDDWISGTRAGHRGNARVLESYIR
jgi:hypothetical protein